MKLEKGYLIVDRGVKGSKRHLLNMGEGQRVR